MTGPEARPTAWIPDGCDGDRGIPLAPWWWHIGLGLDSGGTLEACARWTVLPAAVVWLAAVAAGAPLSWPVDVIAHLQHP